jgi:hypothetical protein
MGCSFCYLPQYGIRIDHSRDNLHRSSVDPQQLIQALEYSEWFRRGRDGTLLSIGSFTDPFLNKEWTIQLLRLVRSLKNPTQIATRVFPGDEAILEIERIFAGRPDQLMINLSINEDTAATRTFMRRWLAFADELNLTLYVKPYLDKTGECLQWFTDLALKHPSLSIVVGSLYFGDKIHLTRDDVLKTHRFCRDLVSPVVPQPTTPGMRNVHEEQFRHDLSKAISRVVFRTSSCALSAKLEIPDPLKNVGTSFCVGTDCANYERCGAQTVT